MARRCPNRLKDGQQVQVAIIADKMTNNGHKPTWTEIADAVEEQHGFRPIQPQVERGLEAFSKDPAEVLKKRQVVSPLAKAFERIDAIETRVKDLEKQVNDLNTYVTATGSAQRQVSPNAKLSSAY